MAPDHIAELARRPRKAAKPGEPTRYLCEVIINQESDECLIWPYARNGDGYGFVKIQGKLSLAHRAVCKIVHGEPPSLRHQAAHSCGNGHLGCVNKRHLSWKTAAENNADKIDHGTHCLGHRNGKAKLTLDQVAEIKSLAGEKSQYAIAAMYGVSQFAIARVLRGVSYVY